MAVWVIRGDAQQTEPMAYGQRFQLVCLEGEIAFARAYVDDFDGRLSLSWSRPSGAENIHRRMSGYMNFVDCVAEPLLAEDVGP